MQAVLRLVQEFKNHINVVVSDMDNQKQCPTK